jgi:hypothetical protein
MEILQPVPDAKVLAQVYLLSKRLIALDSTFGEYLIDKYLNSHNKKVLVDLLNKLISVYLWEEVKKYTDEYCEQNADTMEVHNTYNNQNIHRNIRNLYPILLDGYYVDVWENHVNRCKESLPHKLDIQEIKDLIRIVLSIIADIRYFEYYWAANAMLRKRTVFSISGYWGSIFYKVKYGINREGLILSPTFHPIIRLLKL